MNVEAAPTATEVDASLPLGLALLAPAGSDVLEVLVSDGGAVYPAVIRVDGIRAVGTPGEWYPYGAGSFGAEMML
jgi:hypothetical protein